MRRHGMIDVVRDVLDASVSLPTVIFTVIGAVALILWLVSGTGVIDADGIDEAADGMLGPLGFAEVPALIVLTIVGIGGWAASALMHVYILDRVDGTTFSILAVAVALLSLAIAAGITMVVGPRLGRAMSTTTTFAAADLVGRVAEVRSSTVDGATGYADARLADGTTSRVDIRTAPDHELRTFRSGDVVLLVHYDVDDNSYLVDEVPPELI